jgi:hypothetical protein
MTVLVDPNDIVAHGRNAQREFADPRELRDEAFTVEKPRMRHPGSGVSRRVLMPHEDGLSDGEGGTSISQSLY